MTIVTIGWGNHRLIRVAASPPHLVGGGGLGRDPAIGVVLDQGADLVGRCARGDRELRQPFWWRAAAGGRAAGGGGFCESIPG